MNGDERMRDDGAENDYLWDRSGPVDLDVARMERLLRGQAHADAPRRAPPQIPARTRGFVRTACRSAYVRTAQIPGNDRDGDE